MSHYSIKDLEQLSGIKAHTIRIWEQRYAVLSPKRTPTNIRYYDTTDLKRVLNISVLNDHGMRISRIAQMSDEDMHTEVLRISQEAINHTDQVQTMTLAMIDLDEARFEKAIANNVLRLGLERTMTEIIYPFLIRIGILWQTGTINPAQEHFITNLIRQKLIVAIDGQSPRISERSRKFMLFLPEGELHEIGLLFAAYLIKSRDHEVVYLGQSVPVQDVMAAADVVRPHYLLGLFSNALPEEHTLVYLNTLTDRFAPERLLLAGAQINRLSEVVAGRCRHLPGIKELIEFVDAVPVQDGMFIDKAARARVAHDRRSAIEGLLAFGQETINGAHVNN